MQHFQYDKLKHFYQSEKGKETIKAISQQIITKLPENIGKTKQLKIIGVGFCEHLIENIKQKMLEPQSCIIYPQKCGAIHYQQKNNKNSSVLVDEAKWPIRDNNIDIAILMHSLEFSKKKESIIAELARTMMPMAYAFIIILDKKIIDSNIERNIKIKNQSNKAKIKKIIAENQLTLTKLSKVKCQSPYLEQPEKILAKIIEKSIRTISPIKTGATIYNIRKIVQQRHKINIAENIKFKIIKSFATSNKVTNLQ